jgi:hypothetical protein
MPSLSARLDSVRSALTRLDGGIRSRLALIFAVLVVGACIAIPVAAQGCDPANPPAQATPA